MSLLFRNIEERLEKVDTVIEENAENWRIQRLAKVDLSILRIALIEMFYVEEIQASAPSSWRRPRAAKR